MRRACTSMREQKPPHRLAVRLRNGRVAKSQLWHFALYRLQFLIFTLQVAQNLNRAFATLRRVRGALAGGGVPEAHRRLASPPAPRPHSSRTWLRTSAPIGLHVNMNLNARKL